MFLKVKNQIKNQEKRRYFIVQHFRQNKDNESSGTTIHPPEQSIKQKAEFKHTKNGTFCKKNGQKIFKTAFLKKFKLFFKNLTLKNN